MLPFLDRREELSRLMGALSSKEGTLLVIYGRRRCGKSRLLLEAIRGRKMAYYVGDEREGSLQRRSLSKAVSVLIAGFDRAEYPDWDALLERWALEAPDDSILALDEFQSLAKVSPELPSLLQKTVERSRPRRLFLILCGSSQRMMQGLCLDANAPLYGRAREIIKVQPLEPQWLRRAIPLKGAMSLLEAYALWGGIPRYWELAREHEATRQAIHRLVLDPLGVLREEPMRIILDDTREATQASSVLSLIGEGCHKISEIAARIGKPATSLSRPLSRLVDLGLVRREFPFGEPETGSKRSLYRIADPFLLFWYRFANPRKSLSEARSWTALDRELGEFLPGHLGEIWEDLARASTARLEIAGRKWRPASRWWGAGLDKRSLEFDVVALSEDGSEILVGEAKLRLKAGDSKRVARDFRSRIERFPLAGGREVVPCIWYVEGVRPPAGLAAVSGREVFRQGRPA